MTLQHNKEMRSRWRPHLNNRYGFLMIAPAVPAGLYTPGDVFTKSVYVREQLTVNPPVHSEKLLVGGGTLALIVLPAASTLK